MSFSSPVPAPNLFDSELFSLSFSTLHGLAEEQTIERSFVLNFVFVGKGNIYNRRKAIFKNADFERKAKILYVMFKKNEDDEKSSF